MYRYWKIFQKQRMRLISQLKLKRESLEILTYKDFIKTTVKSGALWS